MEPLSFSQKMIFAGALSAAYGLHSSSYISPAQALLRSAKKIAFETGSRMPFYP
jgi:hypothetical protein